MQTLVAIFLIILGVYLVIGAIFGIVFVWKGVQAIDHGAVEGTLGFKLIIIPGCALFWPYLWRRWARREAPAEERSAHRDGSNQGSH